MILTDQEQFSAGSLAVVATPIGNLADLSGRAAHYLREADLILCEDTRHSRKLLDSCDARAATTSYGSHNVRAKVPWVLEQLRAGKKVALVCDAGTPGISDPGSLLIRSVIQEAIPVTMIPGAAALIPALVLSGLRTDRFVFEGFLPHKKGRKTRLEAIAKEPRTVVMYESVHRIRKTLAELLEHCGDRHAAVCRELTKLYEEIARGKLSELVAHFEKKEPRGEFVIVLAGTEERTEQEEDDSDTP
ncbi:16S rRNA (cytidine(1402)-2'-O)-methyltransferase [bacterium]|nr:16S rRNA (cytidine(1402)-2'-O)-methyltransferase [bacterium]